MPDHMGSGLVMRKAAADEAAGCWEIWGKAISSPAATKGHSRTPKMAAIPAPMAQIRRK